MPAPLHLRREIEEGIELELEADPEAEIAIAEILAKLSEQLDLPFDPSQLPDHFLSPASTAGWPSAHHASAHAAAGLSPATADPDPPRAHPFHPRE